MTERYSLDKAREEAAVLSQKVASGEATDYEEAERQLEDRSSQVLTVEQEERRKRMIGLIQAGKFDMAAKYKEQMPPETIEDSEVRRALVAQYAYNVAGGFFHIIDEELGKYFPMRDDEKYEASLLGLKEALDMHQDPYVIETILERCRIPESVRMSPDIQAAAREVRDTMRSEKLEQGAQMIQTMFRLE